MREMAEDIFYSRVRLAVVAELLQMEWVSFTDLHSATEITRGNLASHLAKLVAAGIIEEKKEIINRRPLTRFRMTKRGRTAFVEHMQRVQHIFEAVTLEYSEAKAASRQRKKEPSPMPSTKT
jgi:DNA-binding MarR family transcriptional regulator